MVYCIILFIRTEDIAGDCSRVIRFEHSPAQIQWPQGAIFQFLVPSDRLFGLLGRMSTTCVFSGSFIKKILHIHVCLGNSIIRPDKYRTTTTTTAPVYYRHSRSCHLRGVSYGAVVYYVY